MTVEWPIKTLRPQKVAINATPLSVSGPVSVTGRSQAVASDAGFWRISLGGLWVSDATKALCFRAIAGLLEGRINPILIPFYPYERSMQPTSGASTLYDTVPHSDGSTFSDGSKYQGGSISVVAAAAVSIRSTTITVTQAYGGTLQAGQHFSIGERLYRIKSVSGTTLTFWPPLREAVAAGARLEFDRPVCRCKLASDTEMNLEIENYYMGTPTVNFVEDV